MRAGNNDVQPGRPAAETRTGDHIPARPRWRDLVAFVPDLARLVVDLARDERVPWRSKLVAGATAAYLISPLDLIPDPIPGVGQLDDLWLAVAALRHLMRSAGYEVVHDLWRGSDEGFALLMVVAGIER